MKIKSPAPALSVSAVSAPALSAPAKINLSLRVISKREDGFHEIISLMQPLSLSDLITITIDDGAGITIACDDPDIPIDGRNLVHKAARAYLDAVGIERKIHIDIEKHIPVAAGLGGGSSDGASTLMGLNEALGGLLETTKLFEIAADLGSDMPFFLMQSSAVASGRGQRLRAVKLPEYSYILINPGFGVSAGWAYSNLTLTETPHNIKITDSEESAERLFTASGLLLERPSNVLDLLENDLAPAVVAEHPEIAELFSALSESGADGVLMSGSGPTVFGLYLTRARADQALAVLKRGLEGRGYRIIAVHGV